MILSYGDITKILKTTIFGNIAETLSRIHENN